MRRDGILDMDEIQLYAEQLNSEVMEETRQFAEIHSSTQPDPVSISDEIWGIVEETTSHQVLACIHPTLDSDEKRKDAIEYVQTLIRASLGVEVSAYGSVPLKTYLPNGDIDLTVLSMPTLEDSLPHDVLCVLHAEQANENAEYTVRDTQFIDAEVKLVKCIVNDFVIDISFNQLGGLSTLCFLEKVDRLVGKEHLFKRSIILIKAWCYYESRILGAHYGLISTYALESLILYIFNLFNATLNGPLAVLYRFLDYFSKFDWENYCISLNGPVCKSSLPNIIVENVENGGDYFLLSEEYIRNCVDMFSVSARAAETHLRVFPVKHLNIIDPLKENNNLGRSVHRGNFFRIRSAFRYGARKLGTILLLPEDEIGDEIKKFFESTLKRHGHKDAAQIIGCELGSLSSPSFSNEDIQHNSVNYTMDEDMRVVEFSSSPGYRPECDAYLKAAASSQLLLACSPERTVISADVNGAVSFRSLHSRKANVSSDCTPIRRDSNDYLLTSHNAASLCVTNCGSLGFSDSVVSSPDDNIFDNLSFEFREKALDSIGGDIETVNMSDLSGDYDSHVRSLLYGQGCRGYVFSQPALCSPHSSSPSQFQNEPSESITRNMPLQRLANTNGAALGKPQHLAKNPEPSFHAFGLDERDKIHGTGTYIPILDSNSSRQRRRNQALEIHCQLKKHNCNNGTNSYECGGRELNQVQSVSGHGEPVSYHNPLHVVSDSSHGNGISILNRAIEFGSFGSLPESNIQFALSNSVAGGSASSLAPAEDHNTNKIKGKKQQSIAEKSLNLENEDDFPPLS